VYYYTRENPQIQALASVYFRGHDREFGRMFFNHAISETGHDKMALNDLEALGENIDNIPFENPLPSTIALSSFAFYQIYNRNSIGYLGYLFFLEFLPTSEGASYMGRLQAAGIPRAAMSFLEEHASVDVHHNKLMEKYAERLIQSQADFDAVAYAMRVTGKLYSDMLLNAFEQVDNPKNWGVDNDEAERKSLPRVVSRGEVEEPEHA
jgi:pyrroloquinoline quinone (PQQ) biosynthesis protein C